MAVLVLLVCCPALRAEPGTLEALGWMSGHWVDSLESPASEEVWLAPAGGVMVGVNRALLDSGKVFYEYLRIEEVDGAIVYFGSPLGRDATPFRLVSVGPGRARFVNPRHDFPQSIFYWLEGDGTLHARVSGRSGGTIQSATWRWLRKESGDREAPPRPGRR